MSTLPDSVKTYLEGKGSRLAQKRDIQALGIAIGVEFPQTFIELFSDFEGGWGAPNNYNFIDVAEIVASAEKTWSVELPKNLLMISDPSGECWLFLDYVKDCVYNVCMDAGYVEMQKGTEPPTWRSFADFLIDYFRKEEDFEKERKTCVM